jgi:hypothetical protein
MPLCPRRHSLLLLAIVNALGVGSVGLALAQPSPPSAGASAQPPMGGAASPSPVEAAAANGAPPPGAAAASGAAAETTGPSQDVQPAAGSVDSAASAEDEAAFAAALAKDTAPSASPPAATSWTAPGNVLNPDLSAILDFALAGYSHRPNLEGGAEDPWRQGFNLQGLELALGAAVDPYFRFDGIITFNREEVAVEEAYATTLDLPWHLQARAGLFLTRFGRINPTHPHTWDFVDQPFAITRVFGSEGSRGLGMELSWLTPLPWYVELVASGTSADGATTALSFLSDSGRAVRTPLDLLYVLAIKQFFALSDDWSLAWGLSSALGPNDRGGEARSDVWGTDLYLKWRPATGTDAEALRVHSELFYRRRHVSSGTLQDANWFVSVAYRFAQRWDAAVRYEYGTPTLDGEGHVTSDYLDLHIDAKRQRGALSITHLPTEFSRLRLQGGLDVPDYLPHPIWSLVLALEIAVGPHRPHPF